MRILVRIQKSDTGIFLEIHHENGASSANENSQKIKKQIGGRHENAAPCAMGWLRSVGSLKLQVSFAKEPCKRDYFLQKRPVILRSLQVVATP